MRVPSNTCVDGKNRAKENSEMTFAMQFLLAWLEYVRIGLAS